MAGAIFMSNSETRDHCFNTGVFGLPLEYGPFVANVKQGMPLFLFDYKFCKLYGVFKAASDGGMDISRTAFRSTVFFNIVWKCKPLTEDEFFPAIQENYYISKKFYFDLSYYLWTFCLQGYIIWWFFHLQVVQLYGLFDKKRVEHPICNYSTSANLEKEHSRRRRPHKRSLTPNSPLFSADRSHTLIPSSTPKISTVETNCSSSTSMHLIVPPTFETQPSVSMPLVTKPFGVQTAPIQSNQIKLPYHSQEHLRDVSAIGGTSTQVSAPYSQTTIYHQDQFVANQSYPSSDDYPHNSLSSGCMTQGRTDGVRFSVKQSYGGSSFKSISPREDVCKQLVHEQDMDMPCPPAELNLPSGLEGEECADPPFLNFKRRNKAAGLDTDVGQEVSDKKKRRKLVRPSFGENNITGISDLQGNAIVEVCPSLEENITTGNSGNVLQGNAITERNQSPASIVERNQSSASILEMNHSPADIIERNQSSASIVGMNHSPAAILGRNQSPASIVERNQSPAAIIERNQSPVKIDGNKFIIDLNEPASVESELAEDGSIAPCPVAANIQTEKSCDVDVISKQDVLSDSGAPTEKITLDLNITDLNTMDEVKLQAILGLSLLQALDKLRNSKSNDDSNKAKSSLSDKNKTSQVKMEMNYANLQLCCTSDSRIMQVLTIHAYFRIIIIFFF
ncbi:hypothetical protein VPH35_129866 [Triticum aestivum]